MFQTHFVWKKESKMTRAILLLRNPLEVAITYRIFKLAGKTKTPKNSSTIFNDLNWELHQKSVFVGWFQHSLKWITSPLDKLHIVYYEKLVENPKEGILVQFVPFFWNTSSSL
jgi:hypothetical protein